MAQKFDRKQVSISTLHSKIAELEVENEQYRKSEKEISQKKSKEQLINELNEKLIEVTH